MPENDCGNANLPARDDLVIKLFKDTCVTVNDRNGHGGGNVSTRPGTTLRWKNMTGNACVLYFWQLLSYTPDGENVPAWPFEGTPPIPPNCVKIENGPGNSPGDWCGVLKPGMAADVKYDVEVLTGANPPPALDPVIIVRV